MKHKISLLFLLLSSVIGADFQIASATPPSRNADDDPLRTTIKTGTLIPQFLSDHPGKIIPFLSSVIHSRENGLVSNADKSNFEDAYKTLMAVTLHRLLGNPPLMKPEQLGDTLPWVLREAEEKEARTPNTYHVVVERLKAYQTAESPLNVLQKASSDVLLKAWKDRPDFPYRVVPILSERIALGLFPTANLSNDQLEVMLGYPKTEINPSKETTNARLAQEIFQRLASGDLKSDKISKRVEAILLGNSSARPSLSARSASTSAAAVDTPGAGRPPTGRAFMPRESTRPPLSPAPGGVTPGGPSSAPVATTSTASRQGAAAPGGPSLFDRRPGQ